MVVREKRGAPMSETMPPGPGPELDARLAEKVGWDTNPELHERDEASDGYSQCTRCGRYASWSESLGALCCPRFSDYVERAIAAAEELLKAGRIEGYQMGYDPLLGEHFAMVKPRKPRNRWNYVRGELAHALTLALVEALK